MPTYEYRCKDCNHQFDIVQSFSDDSLTTCPECDGTLKKVFGNVGISFKGSGFYKTDSRSAESSGTAQGADQGETKKDNSPSSDSSSSGGGAKESNAGGSSSSSESAKSSSTAD